VGTVLESSRLALRTFTLADDDFIFRLLNDAAWIANIGDRGVRSGQDARAYIRGNLWPQYAALGYGMYAVQLKGSDTVIGSCGLVKREFLPVPDLGFALLPEFTGQGYVTEAARRVMAHAREQFYLEQLYALVKRSNIRSLRVLERLGFRRSGPYVTPQGIAVDLYSTVDPAASGVSVNEPP
jgi:[ribosomal protein S5]-alanine N-acetyltransferase